MANNWEEAMLKLGIPVEVLTKVESPMPNTTLSAQRFCRSSHGLHLQRLEKVVAVHGGRFVIYSEAILGQAASRQLLMRRLTGQSPVKALIGTYPT
jgi:hypothetical protein